MPAGTLHDTGAPTRSTASTGENGYVLVDDLSAHHGPGDILAPEELLMSGDEHCSIASASIPGHGTE